MIGSVFMPPNSEIEFTNHKTRSTSLQSAEKKQRPKEKLLKFQLGRNSSSVLSLEGLSSSVHVLAGDSLWNTRAIKMHKLA
uniref:Uncharacterized protein n=1 Tax=Solanum lycopersicum TaxID=4081 RepID=A0A3Q7F717_SOLLC